MTMPNLIGPPPTLIAHRGYSGRYPENTLLAYKKAFRHGARFMELDLQMSSDRVPFVHHDASLRRMSGVDLDIRDVKAKKVKSLRAAYPTRFGDEFADNRFTTFRKFCKWVARHPDLTIFVEIKQESIDRFGILSFVDEAYKRIADAGIESQCVVISFNHEVVQYTQKISSMKTGWVLPKWDEAHKSILDVLRPDYMFCDKESLPQKTDDVWRGDWHWAIYNLDDVESAIDMSNRGFDYLETNEIGTLMADTNLSGSEK